MAIGSIDMSSSSFVMACSLKDTKEEMQVDLHGLQCPCYDYVHVYMHIENPGYLYLCTHNKYQNPDL